VTKEEKREYYKKYYKKNKERIVKQKKEYREKNKERIREQQKEYREKNKERKKEYRENNKERIRERVKEYYENNKERIKEYQKEYNKNLPAAIYKITNRKTDVVYIGQSTSYPKRWHLHKSDLRHNRHDNKQLQEDYNTYGEEAFVFEVIEELPCDTSSGALLKKEAEQIKKHLREDKDIYNSLN